MHRIRAADLFKKPEKEVTKEERQISKALSFQLQYGAGYKSMAEKLGIEEDVAKRFISSYYARYPAVDIWQQLCMDAVQATREPTGLHTPAGYPRGRGFLESPTGRRYSFLEYDPPAWKRDRTPSFSPTEIKNYPVQGFAADVMALFRAKVYRRLMDTEELRENCLLINTVHDSIVLDCKSLLSAVGIRVLLEEEAGKLPEYMKLLWGIDCPCPFPIECKIGRSWGNMKNLDL